MDPIDWLFGAVNSVLIVLTATCLLQYAFRHAKLGRVLWSSSPGNRWLSLIFLLNAAFPIKDLVNHRGGAPRSILALSAVLWCLAGVMNAFPPSLVRVGAGGLSAGMLVLPWTEISGWAWGPAKNTFISLVLSHSGPENLYIWTRSPWRLLHQPIPSKPIRSRVRRSPEIDALLNTYAPERDRSPTMLVCEP